MAKIRSHRRLWLFLAALSSLLAATVLAGRLLTAQPARTGDEIAVDPLGPATHQDNPAAAALPDGRVLVVWNEWRLATARRYFPSLLRGRLYDRTGVPLGPARTLQADETDNATHAALARAGSNGFVLAWHSWVPGPQGEPRGRILARRLDATGRPVGSPIPVSDSLVELASGPFVGTGADGSFLVVWSDSLQRGSDRTDIYLRRFDAAGRPRGGPERFPDPGFPGSRSCEALAVRGDGMAVILWTSSDQVSGQYRTLLSRFDRDGAPLGTVPVGAAGIARGAVAFDSEGGFILVSDRDDGLSARAFDRDGVLQAEHPITDAAVINDPIHLVAAPDGTFLATWTRPGADNRQEMWGIQIGPDGEPLGPSGPLQRPGASSLSNGAAPVANGDSRFAVFWDEGSRAEGLVAGIYGQWLATTGSPGTLELDGTRYAVSEGADEPLTIYVVRRDGTAGAVSVEVSLTGAAQGSQTVTFEDGDSTPRALSIPVADDDLPGGDRTVHVILSDPTGGAVLGSRRRTDIDVRDDDAPFPLLAQAGPVQEAGGADKYESATGPAVAADASGGAVSLWGIDVNPYYAMRPAIAGQRFGPDGHRGRRYWLGARYGSVDRPKVAMQPGGGFVVVWDSAGEDTPVEHLGRGFTAQGAPAGPIFSFGVPVRGVASLPGGRYVAIGGGRDHRGAGLFAWFFKADGERIGRPVRLSAAVTDVPPPSAVAADASGRFVVVWSVFPTGGNLSGLFARRFGPTGAPLGPVFRVSTGGAGYDVAPAVSADPAGDFVVVWQRDWDGDGTGIHARAFDAADLPLGGEIPVASRSAGSQSDPHVALAADGRYLITWTDADPSNASAQLRALPGTRLGGDLILGDKTFAPDAAWSASGQFVMTWVDATGYYEEIKLRRFPLR